jgi:putative CocE/NonD family hydrolase
VRARGLIRGRGFATALAVAALTAAPQAASGATPPYGVSAPMPVSVRMSDGAALAADVYLPTDPRSGRPAAGRFPVILSITPYAKRSAVTTSSSGNGLGGDGHYPYLVRRGYLNAVVDVRGTGSSGGHFELFGARERRDGVELAGWASRLPHASGRVGMAGCSYLGLNQIFTAAEAGPGSPVRAIAPCAAGIDLYRDLAFGGGIPNLEFAATWLALRGTMVAAQPDDRGADPATPPRRALDLAGLDAAMYAEISAGGERAFDGPFWRERAPASYLARVVRNRVPALLLSGWFDVYQRGVVLDYAALQNAASGHRPMLGPMPAAARPSGRYQAVIGPWFHNSTGAGERVQLLLLRWFDRWLKRVDNGMDRTRAPLHAYELRGRRWLDAGRYPLPRARVHRLWLGDGRVGAAPASLNDGALTAAPQRSGGPVGTIGWSDATSPCNRASDQWNTGLGAYVTGMAGIPGSPCWTDDRTTQAGALVYTTGAMPRDVTLAGPAAASLVVRSTTRDAELNVAIEDVAPDGSSYPLTSGALLASHRALDRRRSWRGPGGGTILPYHPYTRAARRFLLPGRAERVEVEVLPTFARVARGHRLRLTISTAATHLHPAAAQARELAGGRYELLRGSFVNLPLADPAALSTSPVNWGDCYGAC